MEEKEKTHLWINLADLQALGTIPPFGSPLMLLLRADEGDVLLPGAYMQRGNNKRWDDVYIVALTYPERGEQLMQVLNSFAKRRGLYKIRSRETVNAPGDTWDCVMPSGDMAMATNLPARIDSDPPPQTASGQLRMVGIR